MRNVTVAAIQMACCDDQNSNVAKGEALIRSAAAQGAQVILLQELFEGLYFCQDEDPSHLARAKPVEGHPTIAHFQALARELGVVLPISFYEKAGTARFNSIAIVDADGAHLGIYRKMHIPHGAGYQEKYYFSPGDTGFQVWDTAFGPHWRWHLLGPVVPGMRTFYGADGCGTVVLPDSDWIRSG